MLGIPYMHIISSLTSYSYMVGPLSAILQRDKQIQRGEQRLAQGLTLGQAWAGIRASGSSD